MISPQCNKTEILAFSRDIAKCRSFVTELTKNQVEYFVEIISFIFNCQN